MAKLIVLSGLDGAGKSTQINLIKKYFEINNLSYVYLHFPMYEHNEAGKVISAYLRGEYGNINEVDPVFVANIYAMDRFLYLPELQKHLLHYDVVLLDRYVFCNMAYQGAKYDNNVQSQIMRDWIDEFEFDFLELPYPDLNIFFDVPIDFIKERLLEKREGNDRKYLNGKSDIHEADINFQEKVRKNYIELENYPGYKIIPCAYQTALEGSKELLWKSHTPDEIFLKYKELLDFTINTI